MKSQPKIQLSLLSVCVAAYFSQVAIAEQQTVMLEEVKVIGEKFERSQSATSASVDVKTDTDFKRVGNAMSVADVVKQSVNIIDVGLGNDLPAVRGVDGSGPAVGRWLF